MSERVVKGNKRLLNIIFNTCSHFGSSIPYMSNKFNALLMQYEL